MGQTFQRDIHPGGIGGSRLGEESFPVTLETGKGEGHPCQILSRGVGTPGTQPISTQYQDACLALATGVCQCRGDLAKTRINRGFERVPVALRRCTLRLRCVEGLHHPQQPVTATGQQSLLILELRCVLYPTTTPVQTTGQRQLQAYQVLDRAGRQPAALWHGARQDPANALQALQPVRLAKRQQAALDAVQGRIPFFLVKTVGLQLLHQRLQPRVRLPEYRAQRIAMHRRATERFHAGLVDPAGLTDVLHVEGTHRAGRQIKQDLLEIAITVHRGEGCCAVLARLLDQQRPGLEDVGNRLIRQKHAHGQPFAQPHQAQPEALLYTPPE